MSSETGRNDPCGCGSGKKCKNCCGAPKGIVAEVRTKDLKSLEWTPGLSGRSQNPWTPPTWNTGRPPVQKGARRNVSGGLRPYRRTSVISQGGLTRWIPHFRTSIVRRLRILHLWPERRFGVMHPNWARTDPCGGHAVMRVPTAKAASLPGDRPHELHEILGQPVPGADDGGGLCLDARVAAAGGTDSV
jgi:hypothetical protein